MTLKAKVLNVPFAIYYNHYLLFTNSVFWGCNTQQMAK